MGAETNRLLTGTYDHVGETIIYGDTDCVYFKLNSIKQGEKLDMESAIKLYDLHRDTVSETFPNVKKDCLTYHKEAGKVMKAGEK